MTVRGVTEVCRSLLGSTTSTTPSRSIVPAKALAVGAIALLTLTQVPSTEAALEVPMVFYSLGSISGGSTALAALFSPVGLLIFGSAIVTLGVMRIISNDEPYLGTTTITSDDPNTIAAHKIITAPPRSMGASLPSVLSLPHSL